MKLESVKEAAVTILGIMGPLGGLDVLSLNAGIANGDSDTGDGYQTVLQTNHLSHMLLLSLLWPAVEQAGEARGDARVVFHTSMARMVVGMPKLLDYAPEFYKDIKEKGGVKTLPAMAWTKSPRSWPEESKDFSNDDTIGVYGLSKAANFAVFSALHEKLQATGKTKIKSLAAHPGTAQTQVSHVLVHVHVPNLMYITS